MITAMCLQLVLVLGRTKVRPVLLLIDNCFLVSIQILKFF